MHFGYWTPVFGGWLRNVDDEAPAVEFENLKDIALKAERGGFDLTLIPELSLNDIRGFTGPTFDAWSTAAALAAVTSEIEILVALRPIFHPVALTAKQAATISAIANGRFSLNVVSGWWEEEARQYGIPFPDHDARYKISEEYVDVLRGLWSQTPFSYEGQHFSFHDSFLEPKPAHAPHIYAGGESEAGKNSISSFADSYLTHGSTPDEIRAKRADISARRQHLGKAPFDRFGMAAFAIVRDTEEEALAELERITDVHAGGAYESYKEFISKSQLDTEVSLEDYSVSNRGLRPKLVGTPEQVAARLLEFEDAGLDLVILQFSPMLEELERFAEQVIPLVNRAHAIEANNHSGTHQLDSSPLEPGKLETKTFETSTFETSTAT